MLFRSPVAQFPPPGPFCSRAAAFILETGRAATFNGLLPGETTTSLEAPTVVINTTPATAPPPPPSSTTSITGAPCPTTTTGPGPTVPCL